MVQISPHYLDFNLYGGARYFELRLLLENNEGCALFLLEAFESYQPVGTLERKSRMRPYKQLTFEERRKIEKWRTAKVSVDVIAGRLGRNRSTIFRELRRNHFTDAEILNVLGNFGVVALMNAVLPKVSPLGARFSHFITQTG